MKRSKALALFLVATASSVAAIPLPDAQYYDDYPLPPPPGDPYGPIHDPYGPIHDPYGPIHDPYGPRHDPYGPIVVDPYSYPPQAPPPPHFDPYYDPYAPYPHPPYPHHPPPPPPSKNQGLKYCCFAEILCCFQIVVNLLNTSCSYTAFHLFQDRTVNREKEKGGVLDFDGEDARKAAQSTRVLADVMDEVADSGDSLDFLGDATFDKDKLMDGLNGASKLVRGFANIMDKGTGAMLGLKDRLGPRN